SSSWSCSTLQRSCFERHVSAAAPTCSLLKRSPRSADLLQREPLRARIHSCAGAGMLEVSNAVHSALADRHSDPDHSPARLLHASFLGRGTDAAQRGSLRADAGLSS